MYDFPPSEMMVTEHQNDVKHCPKCNMINRAAFPEGVIQPVQYGPGVQIWAVYFTQFQLLPYGRTAQLFRYLFGHPLSESFLVNNNLCFADILQPFIRKLKKRYCNSLCCMQMKPAIITKASIIGCIHYVQRSIRFICRMLRGVCRPWTKWEY